jgi:hypothetical protein
MEMTPRARSWRMVRMLRQHPPSLAATDEGRRATFSAALEQSEQFFSAAAASGPQTRGLLLFYGISQAGRALRAAQQPDADWARAGSHGIKVVGESTSGSFADALVRDTRNKPSDAFEWVATTLNRASLPRNIRVGDLARLLFPGGHFPLAGDDPTYAVLELAAVRDAGLSMGRDTLVGGLRANLRVPASTWEVQLPDAPDRTTADYDAYKAHVRAQLAHYPTGLNWRTTQRWPAPNSSRRPLGISSRRLNPVTFGRLSFCGRTCRRGTGFRTPCCIASAMRTVRR